MKQYLSTCVFSSLIALSSVSANEQWYAETLYPEWQQRLRIDHMIHEENTDLQQLAIFENARFGRVLALDGIIQTTEADEFVYHEMMAHIPMIAHGKAEKVLIVGGGDGGMVREVTRHKSLKRVVMVEIDASVVEFSKKNLPMLSRGAFEDPRLELVIADGARFVKETEEKFDVIICDSPDPIGAAAVLFTEEFYRDCKGILTEGGIFVNQNGVPFLQPSELSDTYERRKPHYSDTGFYVAPVTTYVGGFMAFGWATDGQGYRDLSVEELDSRIQDIEGELKYYNAEIHKASFALPNFMKRQIAQ